jgi:hypothetical protein
MNTQLLHAAGVTFTAPPAPLEYLDGKTVECGFPESWRQIRAYFSSEKRQNER